MITEKLSACCAYQIRLLITSILGYHGTYATEQNQFLTVDASSEAID